MIEPPRHVAHAASPSDRASATSPANDQVRRLLPGLVGSPALNRITTLASSLLGVTSSQVSLVADVQTIAAGSGLPAGAVGSTGPAADSLCDVTAGAGEPVVVPDTRTDTRVSAYPPVVSGRVGSYLGVPLRTVAGEVVGALCAFDPAPHSWSANDVIVMQHLAESVRAELELIGLGRDYDLSRARFDLAVQASDMGSFDWDLLAEDLQWDDRLIAIYGYDAGDQRFDRSLASVEARLHPEDADIVATAIRDSITSTGPLQVRYRIVVPGVGVRWLEARGRTLADETGTAVRMLGVTWDDTDRQEAEARAERVLASMSIGYLGMTHDFVVTYVNGEGERLLGQDAAHMVGHTIWQRFPDTVGTEYERVYRRVAGDRVPETFEAFYPAPLNAWFEIRVVPTPDGIALYFLDVTARRDSQQLIEVSVNAATQLVGVDTVDEAAAVLAQVVVPRLADWSIVSLVEPDGSVRDVRTSHVDPALRETLDRYAASRFDGGGSGVIRTVAERREPFVLDSAVLDFGSTTLKSAAAIGFLRELAPESVAVVPVMAEGRVAGVVTMARGANRQPLSEQELDVAISTCRRVGLAIENARLHAEQIITAAHDRTVAQELQRALLTALPEPDHLHLVARYLTAADGDQVGGDWYDAVVAEGGATTIMIGDVVGHDITAAAVMGQLRTILRVFALQNEEPPSTILQRLDQAARALKMRTTATVVTARIEQTVDNRAVGLRTLRWSNAGHPPPILVLADGRTQLLTRPPGEPNDTLIGIAPDNTRHDQTVELPPGSTLVLYTDGLVETRTGDLDERIGQLQDALTRHHASTVDEMLDAVIAEMVGGRPEDDVAILAVRFNPEDRPRPPEAGPSHV